MHVYLYVYENMYWLYIKKSNVTCEICIWKYVLVVKIYIPLKQLMHINVCSVCMINEIYSLTLVRYILIYVYVKALSILGVLEYDTYILSKTSRI